jgi:hypothetical protein
MLYDVAIGAITNGINQPTLLALNVVIGLLWTSLAFLLFHSATTEGLQFIAPHFAVMLGLCTFVGLLINWYIANVGLTDTAEQEASLTKEQSRAVDNADGTLDAETCEELRHLPLQSNIDMSLKGAGDFDTAGLLIQPIAGTNMFTSDKDKSM